MKNSKRRPAAAPPRPQTKDLNVELDGEIRRRLRIYVAKEEATIKAVVTAALDEYLTKRGA